jgi:hypothetical protein
MNRSGVVISVLFDPTRRLYVPNSVLRSKLYIYMFYFCIEIMTNRSTTEYTTRQLYILNSVIQNRSATEYTTRQLYILNSVVRTKLYIYVYYFA